MRKSPAGWLASLPEAARRRFVDALSPNALAAMPWLWELWAHPGHQRPPPGDWRVWVLLGGRGAGKTRAGAEWVRAQAEGRTPMEAGRSARICLLGETVDEVRAVMVEGESGLLAVSPPDRRPTFRASLGRLVWPNGAEATLASAANPEALRGPQFDCAWSDELAKWRRCREAWEMLQFCLRLGEQPRQIVTTTPRDNPVLLELLAEPATIVTRAGTEANTANLAPGFLEALREKFGGTALGRQELEGEIVRDRAGALWTRAMLEASRVAASPGLDRVVVAVDPPAGSGPGSDECGIVAAGALRNAEGAREVFVLEDASVQGMSPHGWARVAADLYARHAADRLVAEVNQGGDMVEAVMRQVAPDVSYRGVRARQGKRVRAEPVAALYEQGRVHHVGGHPELEDQLCRHVAGAASPDRLDALVWAVTELVLDPAAPEERPREPRLRRI